jgi:hypothetical protein
LGLSTIEFPGIGRARIRWTSVQRASVAAWASIESAVEQPAIRWPAVELAPIHGASVDTPIGRSGHRTTVRVVPVAAIAGAGIEP